MLPWSEGANSWRIYLGWFTDWVEANPELALALAVLVPLVWFLLRSVIERRRRARYLQAEVEAQRSGYRLPPETLERNQREERRYRKESQAKSKESKSRGGSGPRYK